MPGQQDKKKPRKRYPSDYRLKKTLPSVLHPRVVQKEACQHVFLYCVGDAVGSPYSEAAKDRLRRIAKTLVALKPGWYLTPDWYLTNRDPQVGEFKVFSVVSPNKEHAIGKFQEYTLDHELEQQAGGGTRRLKVETLVHEQRALGKQPFFETYIETGHPIDGRKKIAAQDSCTPQHTAALGHPGLQRYIHGQAVEQAETSGLSPIELEREAWLRLSMIATDDLRQLKKEAQRAIWAAVQREISRRKKLKKRIADFQREHDGRAGKYEMPAFAEDLRTEYLHTLPPKES